MHPNHPMSHTADREGAVCGPSGAGGCGQLDRRASEGHDGTGAHPICHGTPTSCHGTRTSCRGTPEGGCSESTSIPSGSASTAIRSAATPVSRISRSTHNHGIATSANGGTTSYTSSGATPGGGCCSTSPCNVWSHSASQSDRFCATTSTSCIGWLSGHSHSLDLVVSVYGPRTLLPRAPQNPIQGHKTSLTLFRTKVRHVLLSSLLQRLPA